ncbi:hypothetical protein [Cognatishimia activa]|uniref:Uncharacterized protein n=1 Tax=Cognatishimia activa TaxID=1715691 RepID=A0A0P1IMT3_9RHOB|nr:hypothetical protein [Cognatishimia activa]CUJ14387.1 hypothetical protein TA5113_02431 [Cognatishimia activa]CUK24994.1 hypothetical protein TA5114_00783 [Cognatishimia activa]
MEFFKFTLGAFASALMLVGAGHTQEQSELAPEDSFSLEAAILDTSIPFAVGAHEARQELRGAFGWPTFQEGLVDGVYFRFDPDGYARFSPTPRLDTDVFEVICRPRTHVCMARKGIMNVTLDSKNHIQLELENVTAADTFSIIDGISELQLPDAILQPLDSRMELLLSSGGELLISRGQKEVDRVSLRGFGAIMAYLRWVSAQQSYAVLPRDWPIPNASPAATSAAVTQASSWTSAMPQPQIATGFERDTEVAEVRGELRALRDILFDQQDDRDHQVATLAPATPDDVSISELQRTIQLLGDELARLQSGQTGYGGVPQLGESKTAMTPTVATQPSAVLNSAGTVSADETQKMLAHMEYLVTEIGLTPAAAFELVSAGSSDALAGKPLGEGMTEMSTLGAGQDSQATNHEALVAQVLEELRADLPMAMAGDMAAAQETLATPIAEAEYQLLSDYFRSVFEPR